MLKKSLALLLVLVMAVGVLAGCKPETPSGGNSDIGSTDIENYETPNFNGAKLELYMPVNADFEAEGSYVDQMISKTLNMNLDIHELDNFDAQYNPMLIEGTIPSLTMGNSWTEFNKQLGEDGAMINILEEEYLNAMPHVKQYLENNEFAKQFVMDYSTEPGVLYAVPMIESGTAAVYGYIYRKDVFETNNMKFPTTQDEFYNTLKQLKTLYPDSYPFVMRQMSGLMQGLAAYASTWGISHQTPGLKNTYITLQNDKYIYAPATNEYKEMLTYIKKLMDEKLMHPSVLTMDTAGWTEAFASNTSFIGFDKMDRVPSLNAAGTELNPDFKLVGAAGIAMGSKGRVETQVVTGATVRFYMIGDNDQLADTLKYVDWLYSEEGIEVTNWGIEGESFKVNADGEKELIMDFVNGKGSYNATGFGKFGLVGYSDFDSYLSSIDEDMANSIAVCMEKSTVDRQALLAYDEDDQEIINIYAMSCNNHAMSNLGKFISGQRDFSEWDAYVNELNNEYHLNDLIKAHENAYQVYLQK